MSLFELDRNSFEPHDDALSPETLRRLGDCVTGFAGEAVMYEWSEPEIDLLRGIRVIISRSDLLYTESEESFSRGRRADAVFDMDEISRDRRYSHGGETLARAVFTQMGIDRYKR